jgi:hypothetical protein
VNALRNGRRIMEDSSNKCNSKKLAFPPPGSFPVRKDEVVREKLGEPWEDRKKGGEFFESPIN